MIGFEVDKRIRRKYGNRPEEVTIGGKTIKVRSQGEKRLAQYLEVLKVGGYIVDWFHEWERVPLGEGTIYLPDFHVFKDNNAQELYEFKGKLHQADILKYELLFRDYPGTVLHLVFENKREAAKFARRKVSRLCTIWIQSKAGKGLTEFDGKAPNRKGKKNEDCSNGNPFSGKR